MEGVRKSYGWKVTRIRDRDVVVNCRIESRIARGNARSVPPPVQGLVFEVDLVFRDFSEWKSGETATSRGELPLKRSWERKSEIGRIPTSQSGKWKS
jgi:hypothetical protein